MKLFPALLESLALMVALLAPGPGFAADRDLQLHEASAPMDGRRVALVVGNGAYTRVDRLAQAPHDASVIASTLQELGFEVDLRQDLSQAALAMAVADFETRLSGAQVGFFYYAGHAVQLEGRNFLVPVDADIQDPRYVEAYAFDILKLLSGMERARSRLNVVVLDSCRNNPFAGRWFGTDKALSSSGGLAPVDAPSGFIIGYATGPGRVASDNGVYAQALSRSLLEPGREISRVFQFVHQEVRQGSHDAQIPWLQEARGPQEFFPAGAPRESAVGGTPALPRAPRAPDPVVTSLPRPGSSGARSDCELERRVRREELRAQLREEFDSFAGRFSTPALLARDSSVLDFDKKWGAATLEVCGARVPADLPEARLVKAWISGDTEGRSLGPSLDCPWANPPSSLSATRTTVELDGKLYPVRGKANRLAFEALLAQCHQVDALGSFVEWRRQRRLVNISACLPGWGWVMLPIFAGEAGDLRKRMIEDLGD